ncbi:MAG: sigma-54-dependent Fis family transcriptional regulator [Alphaproteobacteria bacterium]|nr:sigma-54-dependent Fis family transcriptional regulator [Alphaproteobacteria bacterium]
MSDARPLVLLIEDTPSLAALYVEYLRREPIRVVTVATGGEGIAAIRGHAPAAVLLDLNLPDMPGMEILKEVTTNKYGCSVIVVTAHGSINVAVEAMRHGAYDFLMKPFDPDRLKVTLRNALAHQKLLTMVETYRETFDRTGLGCLIGSSLPMQQVYRIIESAAPSRATVFVTGESGTGKELCAAAIHQLSPRRGGPYVALNCAAISRELIESEIFGHVKGAFTGATVDRDGAASRANGGTLFLDELCEMDLSLQSKLLRFLQTSSFVRVGGNHEETADLRFICATNRDPFVEVRAGRLREDLFYRLHVVPVHMPPLRERGEDVLLLANYFLSRFAEEEGRHFRGFAPDAEAALLNYDWPGNVRQLQNAIRNAVVLNDGETVTASMLPAPLTTVASSAAAPAAAAATTVHAAEVGDIRPLADIERETIERAIALCGGNIPRAAELLDISPSTIYRKRQRWLEDGVAVSPAS